MANMIEFTLCCVFIMLDADSLPIWRMPMLIVGFLNDGASIIPLLEFPIIKSQYFSKER